VLRPLERAFVYRTHANAEVVEIPPELLGREMLDQRFAGMKQALENATDEDRQRVNDMLDDLNDLLDKHSRGEDTEQDFKDFMDKHGEFFPENPKNIDELLENLRHVSENLKEFTNTIKTRPYTLIRADAPREHKTGEPR
jgi:uncharacterized protein with von Willebrand factor type A (vWA) domain